MCSSETLVRSDEALIILGSLNSNESDRRHVRSEIHPVRVFFDGKLASVSSLDALGELGMSAMAWVGQSEPTLFWTTGADLVELRIGSEKIVIQHDISHLKDVHEITIIDDVLWLANTGYDEVVAYDFREARIIERLQLAPFRQRAAVTIGLTSGSEGEITEVDRFHCNQVFAGFDGKHYVLVHHTTGKQLLTRVQKKITKRQGDGGVIELTSGRSWNLWLHAPHSVRIVNDAYWVFDSGGMTVNVYDPDWKLQQKIATKGWGRGADLSADGGLFYAGISEPRARYRSQFSTAMGNMVQIFDTSARVSLGTVPIPDGIEQVNNVYVIPNTLAQHLLSFPPLPAAVRRIAC